MAHLLFGSPARAALLSSSRRTVASSSSSLDNLPNLLTALCLPSTSAIPSNIPSFSRSRSSTNPKFARGLEKSVRLAGKLRKARNIEQRVLLGRVRQETKPDPILGYKPGNTREPGTNDEKLWLDCELKKLIISPEDVWGLQEDSRGNLNPIESAAAKGTEEEQVTAMTHGGPLRLNFGLTDEDRSLVFSKLPEVNIKDRLTLQMAFSENGPALGTGGTVLEEAQEKFQWIELQEGESKDKLSRILDLRNASAKGVDVYNKARILEHFGAGGNVGSVESQVAIITYRLHRLYKILNTPTFRKDNASRRSMNMLTHKRAKLLKYIRKRDLPRYLTLLSRVGVNRRAVEGEITLPGMPKLGRAS